MTNQSLWEQFSNGVGDAMTDIRQKVVEEPLYGRAVTDGPEAAPLWEPSQSPSFGSSTHEVQPPTQELDLDR